MNKDAEKLKGFLFRIIDEHKSANTVKHKILIPIKDFLAWYGYEGQN